MLMTKKKFKILDMGILGCPIETKARAINQEHLKKFPK